MVSVSIENIQPTIISVIMFADLASIMPTPNSITERSFSSVQSVPQTRSVIFLLSVI